MAYNHSWQSIFRPGQSDDYFLHGHPVQFVAQSHRFNPVNAWWLSELSRLMYRKDATEGVQPPDHLSRNDYLGRVNLVERHFFDGPTIQAALVENIREETGNVAVLVFRGTSGRLTNWLVNLDMVMRPWSAGGKVHRGFKSSFLKLWDTIATALEAINKPLFYTGHSLGGALATLAASLHHPQAVYTFGSPRIGDAAFAQSLSDVPVFNISNPRDIVPGLPPSASWWRFTHAGIRVNNTDIPQSQRRLAQAPTFLAGHAPVNYTAQLPIAFDN
jgi:hypothetical protein